MRGYNNFDFMQFANILNNTSGALNELYNIFLEECDNLGVDPKNPIFYKGSQKDLIESEKANNERNVDFSEKNFITIINDYLLGDFSTETKVQIFKQMDSKMYEYLDLMRNSILYKQLICDTNENSEFEEKFLSSINEVFERGQLAKRQIVYKSKNELLFGTNEELTAEQRQKSFSEINKEVASFLESALYSKENIKKCVDTIDLMIKNYRASINDNDFTFRITIIFNQIRNFLQFQFDHYEEMSNYLKENYDKVKSVHYSPEELEEKYMSNVPKPRQAENDSDRLAFDDWDWEL